VRDKRIQVSVVYNFMSYPRQALELEAGGAKGDENEEIIVSNGF
jgi:hypothetical protein